MVIGKYDKCKYIKEEIVYNLLIRKLIYGTIFIMKIKEGYMEYFISESWDKVLGEDGINCAKLSLEKALKDKTFFTPAREDIFNAFKYTPLEDVKVLILGQDPYPDANAAHGLSFSSKYKRRPPSLKHIFEVAAPNHEFTTNTLTGWAKQGVLLLNISLTFDKESTLTNRIKIWKDFIDRVFGAIINRNKPLVVMLWGEKAQKYKSVFENCADNVLVLTASHPSSFSFNKGDEKFIECDHFNKCNKFLKSHNQTEIDWTKL